MLDVGEAYLAELVGHVGSLHDGFHRSGQIDVGAAIVRHQFANEGHDGVMVEPEHLTHGETAWGAEVDDDSTSIRLEHATHLT